MELKPNSFDDPITAGAARKLDYYHERVHSGRQLLIGTAAAFCGVALALLFVEPEIASIPGLISAVVGFVAYWRHREIPSKSPGDTVIKIVVVLGIVSVLPTVWYTWEISGWAQSASSRTADELMDRGKVILEACRIYASKHGGAFPDNLATLCRESMVRVSTIGPCATPAPSDAEIERCSEFLYFGKDLRDAWSSRQVVVLLSTKTFAKYGGSGRAIAYGDGQSLFCFDRDLPDAITVCNRVRVAHGLSPIAP